MSQVSSVSVLESIRKFPDIPTLSGRYYELLDVIQGDNPNVNALVKTIERDVGFASKLLKVANSAFYLFSVKVDSINKAVSLMGYKEILTISLTMDIMSSFRSLKGIDANQFWNHSVTVATLFRDLSQNTMKVSKDVAYTIGLLHDIGALVVAKYYPEIFKTAVSNTIGDKTIFDAETELLGCTHLQVTAELAKFWKLPETVYKPIVTLLDNNLDNIRILLYKAHKIVELQNDIIHWDRLPKSKLGVDLTIDYAPVKEKASALLSSLNG